MNYSKHKKVIKEALEMIETDRRKSAKAFINACKDLLKSMEEHEKSGKQGVVIYRGKNVEG